LRSGRGGLAAAFGGDDAGDSLRPPLLRFDHSLDESPAPLMSRDSPRCWTFAAGRAPTAESGLTWVRHTWPGERRRTWCWKANWGWGQKLSQTPTKQTKGRGLRRWCAPRAGFPCPGVHSAAEHHRGRFAHRGDVQLQDDVLAAERSTHGRLVAHGGQAIRTLCWTLCRWISWPPQWRGLVFDEAAQGSTVSPLRRAPGAARRSRQIARRAMEYFNVAGARGTWIRSFFFRRGAAAAVHGIMGPQTPACCAMAALTRD